MSRVPLILALACWVVGCATGQARSPETTPATATAGGSSGSSHDEILRLERRIDAGKAVLGLGASSFGESQVGESRAGGSRAGEATPGQSAPGTGDATQGAPPCEQTCLSAGSICEASRRICALADELDDDWARGRCTLAARTCGDARRKALDLCGTCSR